MSISMATKGVICTRNGGVPTNLGNVKVRVQPAPSSVKVKVPSVPTIKVKVQVP